MRPHKFRYWLTSPDKKEDPVAYQQAVEQLCETYRNAPAMAEEGIHVVSCDEKTGIQALERKHPNLPPRPGAEERIEFEYARHGTLCLIANWDVVEGRVREATIRQTRTEQDFVEHIRASIDRDPQAGWVFVVDQLNTHLSESRVALVAKRCGISGDLGVKGKRGTLKSKHSRKQFLADTTHRIRRGAERPRRGEDPGGFIPPIGPGARSAPFNNS